MTWEEDIAYRRMLDVYYLRECALPLDIPAIARLIRMRESHEAIQTVLAEFFVKSDDGWHNKRADEELTAMAAKKEQQSIKDEHEADRMRRHRERRAKMFAALRERGIVPAWDVPIKDLQRLFDEIGQSPETDLQREQVVTGNAPATAIPTPIPIPIPTPIKEKEARASRFDARAHLISLGVESQIADDWLAHRKAKNAKPTLTAINGVVREAAKARIALSDALSISCQRGWVGFEADWIAKDQQKLNGHRQAANLGDERAYTSAVLTGKVPSGTTLEQFMAAKNQTVAIEGEASRVA